MFLDRPELVVKKLRYYARYIVVCLLLNKMDLVKVLVKVLKQLTPLRSLSEQRGEEKNMFFLHLLLSPYIYVADSASGALV